MQSFLLRLPDELHGRLKSQAARAGMSMNEFCVTQLDGGSFGAGRDANALVNHARRELGDDLIGVVLFGSSARGEATQHSDVDALVVVEPRLPITRELYRTWDRTPQTIDQRAVDAHLTHLPHARVGGGLWAEAAVEGIVIADSDHRIHAALVAIRRDMAAGLLRRHAVHGQSYWTTAA